MKYKVYLKATMCDRFTSNFMQMCNLGITDVGVPVKISFTTDDMPTETTIQLIIDKHLETKNNKSLEKYFENVKLDRIELIKEDKEKNE